MPENKDYFCVEEEQGSIRVSEDVVSSIASIACRETEGVASFAPTGAGSDLAEMFAKKGTNRGVKVVINENGSCDVDLHINVKFGSSVTEVAKNVQMAVKTAIESMAGAPVSTVDVQVAGIAFQK